MIEQTRSQSKQDLTEAVIAGTHDLEAKIRIVELMSGVLWEEQPVKPEALYSEQLYLMGSWLETLIKRCETEGTREQLELLRQEGYTEEYESALIAIVSTSRVLAARHRLPIIWGPDCPEYPIVPDCAKAEM